MSEESLQSSLFNTIPKEILKMIIVESGNPMIFVACKYFNSFSKDPSFWRRSVKDLFGEIVDDFANDWRVAVKRPTSWPSYITSLFAYHKLKRLHLERSTTGMHKRIQVVKFQKLFLFSRKKSFIMNPFRIFQHFQSTIVFLLIGKESSLAQYFLHKTIFQPQIG